MFAGCILLLLVTERGNLPPPLGNIILVSPILASFCDQAQAFRFTFTLKIRWGFLEMETEVYRMLDSGAECKFLFFCIVIKKFSWMFQFWRDVIK